MYEKEPINGKKQKKYYALNLTEGRIFIIFISILILISMLAFGIAILNSSNKNKIAEVEQIEQNNEANNHAYYSELSDNIDKIPEIDSEKSNQNQITQDNSKNLTNNNELELITKNDNSKTTELNNNQKNEEKNSVELDNSEILYSSKLIKENRSEKNKISIKKEKNYNKNENKKNRINKEKTNKLSSTSSVRYIVQIGSYTNKKTAEDISIFYQMQGYPAFIDEKQTKGQYFYRLRIGPFKEKNRAEKYLASLRTTKYGKESYISIIYL